MSAPPAVSAPPAYGVPPGPPAGYPPPYPAQPGYPGQPGYPPGLGVPAAPAYPPMTRQLPAYLAGDWAGAAIVMGLGIGAMFGMSLVVNLIAAVGGSGSTRASAFISNLFQLVGMAAGGSVSDNSTSLYFRPLGLTVVGYAVIAVAFVQRLRRTGPLTATVAGLQAARLAVLQLGALLIVALLSRAFSPGGGRGAHLEVFSTMFFGTVTLGVALFTAWVVALPGLLPARAEHYRTLICGPVKAVLFLAVTSCAAALLLVLVLVATQSTRDTGNYQEVLHQSGLGGGSLANEWSSLLTLIVAFLPTIAGWALLVGIGVPITASGGGGSGSNSILDLVDRQPLFWLWPIVAILLVVAAGRYAAQRSPVAPSGRPVGWWFAAVLPTALFVLALLTSIRADVGERSSTVGLDLLFVLLFGALYGAGAGMLGTVLVARQPPMAGYAGAGQTAPVGWTPPAGAAPYPGIPAQPGTPGFPTPPPGFGAVPPAPPPSAGPYVPPAG